MNDIGFRKDVCKDIGFKNGFDKDLDNWFFSDLDIAFMSFTQQYKHTTRTRPGQAD